VGGPPYAASLRGDWRAAAADWDRRGCPYERAEALADGDGPAIEEALEIFLGLGAAPAADRVRQRLRRLGIRRRGARAATRGHPAGLTPREAEILALIAEHLSNPAIAERLFVSAKTVEHHVSALLAKLGAASREEAAALAHRQGWLARREK
jgi:DNA-binding NarL/FixJ family response regulator